MTPSEVDTFDVNNSTGTFTVVTSVNSGDLVVAVVVTRTGDVDGVPSGFTEVHTHQNAGADRFISVYEASAVTGNSFQFDSSGSSRMTGALYVFTDGDTGGDDGSNTGSDTDTTCPSGTTAAGSSSDRFGIAAFFTDGGASLSGYSNGFTTRAAGSVGRCWIADKEISDANAVSEVITFTASENCIGAVIVYKAAAAGGANPKGPLGMPFHGPFGGPISV